MPSTPSRKRPVVLVTPSSQAAGAEFDDPSTSLSFRYSDALIEAGAVPLILPPTVDRRTVAAALQACDGIVFSGGDDLGCSLHRPDASPELMARCAPPDLARDVLELELIHAVLANPRPVLAICRGHQIFNVALGGTLVLDLPTERPSDIPHNACDRKDETVHPVALDPKSLLAKITRSRSLAVNSTHHQAIDQLAEDLRPVAVAPDGIVEATELADHARGLLPWFISVQFHPERLAPSRPEQRRLLKAFVDACRKRA